MPVDLRTWALVRELASGDVLAVLAAQPMLASFGDEEDALLEARMFLSEHLAHADPDVALRFALPDGARLHVTDVVVPRDDLTRRWNVAVPIRIPSLLLPSVPNTKGLRDTWAIVLPLLHTCFARAGEDVDEIITSEVKRIVNARELTPLEYLDLLPAREERLERVEVRFERPGARAIGEGARGRTRLAEH